MAKLPQTMGAFLMQLTVNGESHEHTGDGSVAALLAELGASPEHSAVTVNGDLVCSRVARVHSHAAGKDWKTFKLNHGDTVEVLTFVGGG